MPRAPSRPAGGAVEGDPERVPGRGQRDAVLRARRPRQGRLDVLQVQRQVFGVDGLGRVRVVPEALGPGIGLHQGQVFLVAPGEAQVVERDLVDREHRAGGAVLGAHVADGGAGLERQGGDARSVTLDERADDAVVAQELGDREHDVGGGDARPGLAGDAQADHGRQEHRQGLAEHGGLRLDAADTPAQHAQAVDHDGVRVGAHERVAERPPVLGGEDEPGEVLEVHLVADAGARWDHAEVPERALGPAQHLVALEVARVLDGDVGVVGRVGARAFRDDGVVDDQLDGHQRVHPRRVATEVGQRVAHRRQVDDRRDTGEVLHEHTFGGERDLVRRAAGPLSVAFGVDPPGGHRHDVVGRDVRAVLVAQEVLEQHLDGIGQPLDVVPFGQRRRQDAEDLVGPAAHDQVGPGAEGVRMRVRGGVGAHGPHSAVRLRGPPNGPRSARAPGASG